MDESDDTHFLLPSSIINQSPNHSPHHSPNHTSHGWIQRNEDTQSRYRVLRLGIGAMAMVMLTTAGLAYHLLPTQSCDGFQTSKSNNDPHNLIHQSVTTAPAPSSFSDARCLGDYDFLGPSWIHNGAMNSRSCSFESVCWNDAGELLFYSDPSLPSEPQQVSNAIYGDFPPKFVNIRKWIDNENHFSISLRVIRSAIPSNAVWSPAGVHVFYGQFWSENFGHVLGDDVYPAYQLMRMFNVLDRHAQILAQWECWFSGGPDNEAGKRSCKSTHQIFGALTDRPWMQLRPWLQQQRSQSRDNSSVVCARQLLVGSALQGMSSQGRNWPQFITYLTKGFSPALQATRPTRMQILFIKKTNRRRIVNLDETVDYLRKLFDVEIVLWEPDGLTFDEQVAVVRQYPLLITPCGGISFISPFLYPGSSVLYIDYFDPQYNSTMFMEEYIWQWDPRFNRYHYLLQREDVVELDVEAKNRREGNETQFSESLWWRGYPIHRLNPVRMAYFVMHALKKAAKKLEITDTLNYEKLMAQTDNFKEVVIKMQQPSKVTIDG